MSTTTIRWCLMAVTLVGLAACGGGGGGAGGDAGVRASGSSSPPPAPPAPCVQPVSGPGAMVGGIEGTGRGVVARGAIRNLPCFIVAGAAFDLSQAVITIDGQPATPDRLSIGQVTTVQGTTAGSAAAPASAVVSETRVAGIITLIDTAGGLDPATVGHLVVLGQPVLLLQSTILPAGLAVGDVVAVSAFANSDGSLTATRIDRRSADLEYLVTGTATHVDASAHRFAINGLSVDYSGAVPQGFTAGVIHNGDLVRVFGRLPAGSATLSARAVELRLATPPGQAGELILLSGHVTRFASGTDFDVDGVPITTAADTVFEPPFAELLALDMWVIVSGTLLADGHIGATSIVLDALSALPSIGSTIQTIDATAGVLQVLGVTVTADASTQLSDRRGTTVPRLLALSDLHVGDYVWVSLGQQYGIFVSIASRIERRNPLPGFLLTGPLLTGPAPLTLSGIALVADDHTQYIGSCGVVVNQIGVPNSPKYGPCAALEFWPAYNYFDGPIAPFIAVKGQVRASDGALLANVIDVVDWE